MQRVEIPMAIRTLNWSGRTGSPIETDHLPNYLGKIIWWVTLLLH